MRFWRWLPSEWSWRFLHSAISGIQAQRRPELRSLLHKRPDMYRRRFRRRRKPWQSPIPPPPRPWSAPIEKAPPIAKPLDVPAYLRGLGITDKQVPERGVPLRTFDFSLPIPPNEWRTLAPLMDDVQYIIFHNQSGDDEAISHVAKLPLLRRLSLDGQPVTDKGCMYLKDHPSLERLDLANTAISGAAIADLASIPNLSAFDLRKTAVRGACWKPLLHSRVSSLWLAGNPIEDGDLADLAGDPSLSMVQLSSTHVTDAVIDTLASMPNFRQGDFGQTSIDDVGALKLSRLPNIVTLELSGCPIGEDSLAAPGEATKTPTALDSQPLAVRFGIGRPCRMCAT